MEFYETTFVHTYEEDMAALRKNAPQAFTNFSLKYMKNMDKSAKIIDIAAGTGLVRTPFLFKYKWFSSDAWFQLGMELRKHGFHNLYGHDGSREMLKIAEERKIYKECYEEILLENKPSVTMPKNGFDILISLGGFA